MVFNTLRKLAHKVRQDKEARRRQAAHRGGSARLQLEQLEDRTLLSTFQWIGAGPDTLWTDSQNWALIPGTGTPANSYPNALGDIAQFTGSPSGNGTVSLNQAITVGEVDFGTATNITISSTNNSALTLDNTGFGPKAFLTTQPANTGLDLINVTLNAGTTPVAATLAAGTLQLNNTNAGANSFGSTSSFTVNGGTLDIFAANNTGSANLAINNGGTVLVSQAGTLSSTPSVSVNSGGTLKVNDNAGLSTAGRFDTAAGASFVLNGGTFSYLGASTNSSDTLPSIKLNGGSSTILTTTTAVGSVVLTSPTLTRQPGATVSFLGSVAASGTVNLDTPANRFAFTTPPTTVGNNGGILPWAMVLDNNFGDFATYDTTNGSVGAFSGYLTSFASATANSTVQISSAVALSSSIAVNALDFVGAGSITLAPNVTLTLASGGLLNAAPSGGTIIGGTLAFGGTGEGIVQSAPVAGATASFYNLGFAPANSLVGLATVNFNQTATASRVDPSLNYPSHAGLTGSGGSGPAASLPTGVTVNSVAAQWLGTLNVVSAGSYTFTMNADGAYLFIDGLPAFSIGGQVSTASLPVALTAGPHTLKVLYSHGTTATAVMVVSYSGPDTGNVTVVLAGATNPIQAGLVTTANTDLNTLIAGGTTSLTVGGPGILTLPTANTYGGSTYLGGGTLNLGNSASLGNTGTLNLAGGALQASAGITLANPFSLTDGSLTLAGVNNVTLSGTGTLLDSAGGTNTLNVTNQALTVLSGKLTGSGNLTVTGGAQIANPLLGVAAGTGNVVLSGATNDYSGGTVLSGGSLIVASNSALGGGPLTLRGGTLLSDGAAHTFTNQVVLSGAVTLSASAYSPTNSGSASGSSFTFSGLTSVASNTNLTVSAPVTFSNVVSGSGQLTVTGLGSLTLSNAANTYAGGTVLNAGSLAAAGTLSVASSSGVTGGILTSGSLGTGPLTLLNGTLQANGSSPIAIANQLALGGGGYVAFGGTTTSAITFSQSGLNSPPTDTVSGTANLLLNNTTTTINEALSDGTASGNLTVFSGTGTLALTQADNYTGSTIVNGGTLTLSGAGALNATGGLTLNQGGVFTTDTGVAVPVTLNGGTLNFVGLTNTTANFGFLTAAGGDSTVASTPGTGTATLAFTGFSRLTGATVNFLGGNSTSPKPLGTATNQILLGGVANGFITGATVTDGTTAVTVGGVGFANSSGFNFATYGANGVAALTTYQALNISGGNLATDNVLVLATGLTSLASETVNSLLLVGDGINLGGISATSTLTVASGMVASTDPITNSPLGNTISVPTLAFGATEGLLFTNAGSNTINSTITGTGGLTMGGPGTLALNNANNYSAASAQAESQIISFLGNPTGGTYTLSFNGATTSAIQYTAPATGASSIQSALQALGTIGVGNVSVAQSGGLGSQITVTFTNNLAGQLLPLMTVAASLVGGTTPSMAVAFQVLGSSTTVFNGGTLSSGSNFVNSGTLTLGTNNAVVGGLTLTGGTLQASETVTLPSSVVFGTNGSGSAAVTLGSSNASTNNPIFFTGGAFLNGLTAAVSVANPASSPIVITGNVSSTPSTFGSASNTVLIKEGGGTLILTAASTYTGATLIQGGTVNIQNSTALGISGNAVQTLTFGGTVTGGTFTLSFNGATTGPITWSATGSVLAFNIQYALNALSTIGLDNAAVSGTGPFTVTFQNQLGATNVAILTANFTNLTGTGPTVTPGMTTAGSASGTVVASGATLQLQAGLNSISVAEPLTIAGSGSGSGAVQNITGTNTLSNGITLSASAAVGGDTGSLALIGNIGGAADLTKLGGGTLLLAGDNYYTGNSALNAGVVQITAATSLGTNAGGTTVISGATLQFGRGTANVSKIGVVAGEALTVSGTGLGLVDSTLLTFSGALQANSGTSIDLTGNVTLSADTTIANVLTDSFSITGVISGSGGLTKVAVGPVVLGGADTFTGTVTVQVGTLSLAGLGSWQPLTSPGINAVQTLTFGGTITSSTASTFTLTFNGATTTPIAYSSVAGTLQTSIQNALGALSSIGGTSNILVSATSATSVNITFQNQLGKLTVPLMTVASSLTGTNPTVTVAPASAAAAAGLGAAALTVRVSATFTIDNTAFNLTDRFSDAASISLSGGTMSYLGNNFAGLSSTETIGVLAVAAGSNTLSVTSGSGANSAAILTSAALFRASGATVNFVGATTAVGTATTQVLFTSPITAAANAPYAAMTNGILPFATVQSSDFAAYSASAGITAFANYVTNLSLAGPNDNVKLSSGATLSSNLKVNSLVLSGTPTLTIGAGTGNYTLTVGSGGLITTGGTSNVSGGTLDFGTAEGIVLDSSAVNISSSITGTNGMTISGGGTTTLSGTGVYTGTTTIDGTGISTGTVTIASSGALGNTTVAITAGLFGLNFGSDPGNLANPLILNNSTWIASTLSGTKRSFSGNITLYGFNTINPGVSSTYLSGSISGPGSLSYEYNTATVFVLEGNNTYSGGTFINALGGNGIDVTSGTAFGTGSVNWFGGLITQVRYTTSPSLELGSAAVTINNPFVFANSSVTLTPSNATTGPGAIIFAGPVTATGSNTISVTTINNVTFSGVISGAGSLNFAPDSTSIISLTNANTLTGGINLTGAGTMILGNSSALGTGPYIQTAGILQDDGVHSLTIGNPVVLDSTSTTSTRTISATSTTGATLAFAGIVTSGPGLVANTAGAFTKSGVGALSFGNPLVLTNSITVNQGTMTLTGGASITATALTVNSTASLVLDNSSANNVNRIGDNIPITLAGGTFAFKGYTGPNSSGIVSSETLGAITLGAGNSTISSSSTGGGTSILNLASLTRSAGALLTFAGMGANIGSASNQINVTALTTAPTAVNNYVGGVNVGSAYILPYFTVTGTAANSLDFGATVTPGTSTPTNFGPFSIVPFAGYLTAGLATANFNGLDVAKITSSDVSSANVVAALISGDNINLSGASLGLSSGVLLCTGGTSVGDTVSDQISSASATDAAIYTNANSTLNVNGGIAGGAGLTIGGGGTLVLSAANSYSNSVSPGTRLTAGTLVLNNNSALGTGTNNNLVIINGAIQSGSNLGITITNAVALPTTPGGATFSGANPLTIAAVISGTGGSLTVNTSSTLTFAGSAANTYSGTTTINAGTLVLAKTAGSAFAGQVVINAGTVSQTGSVSQLGSQAYTINSGGTLDISPGTAGATVSSLTLNAGSVTIGANTLTLSSYIVALSNASPSSISATTGSLAIIAGNPTTWVNVAPGAGGLNISAAITGGATAGINKIGLGTLIYSGSTANTYGGYTNVDEGSLILSKTAAVPAIAGPLVIGTFNTAVTAKLTTAFAQLNGQNVVVNNQSTLDLSSTSTIGQTVGTLTVQGGTVLTGSNTLVLGGTLTGTAIGTSSATINGNLDLGTTSPTFTAIDAGTVPGLTINAVIASASGNFGINKYGPGTVVLAAPVSNTFTGATYVYEGTLLLNSTGLGVQTITFGGTITSSTASTFKLTFNGQTTAAITYSNVAATLASNITNALTALSTIGTGNVSVSSSSTAPKVTFQGTLAGTNISLLGFTNNLLGTNPTISIAGSGGTTAVPAGGLTVGDGVGGSGVNKVDVVRLAASTQISSTGSLTINNSGLLDLNNNSNTFSGLTISGGTVNTGTGTFTLAGNVVGIANPANITPATINGNLALGSATRQFDVNAGNLGGPDMVVNAIISGTSVGLTKVDSGTLQLTATESYNGSTTVNFGTLQVDGSLASSVVTVSGSGAVLSGIGTLGAVTVTSGGSVNPGAPSSSVGILKANSVNLSSGGNLTLEIAGLGTAGTNFDQLNLTGALTLDATSTLTLDLAGLAADGQATGVVLYSTHGTGTFAPANISTINNATTKFLPVLSYAANQLNIGLTGPATHFAITGVTSAVAGTAFNFTVSALDQFNNVSPSYVGTVHFSSTDANGSVLLPANTTLTNGVGTGTFSATLITSGNQTLTAVDATTSTIAGNVVIAVNAGAATHFAISSKTSIVAGRLLIFTVTALDQFSNTATGYGGTAHFSSSDSQAFLSDDSTLTSGVGSFGAILRTAGNQTITATDTVTLGINGTTNGNIAVSPSAVTHLGILAPPTASPGVPFTITVAAQDQFNNTVPNYTGTVHFTPTTGSVPGLVVPADYTFVASDNGKHVFTNGVTLVSAPSQTLTATDASANITGSATVSLVASTVQKFIVGTPSISSAGFPFALTVTALDQFGNTVFNYNGTVHFTSSDSQPSLPADSTLINGTGFFGALLRTAGNDTISVTDTANANLTGTSQPIVVTGLAASHFAISTGATAVVGSSVSFTVTAKDQFNNIAPTYTGSVHFTSSDAALAAANGLPSNYTFTAGDNGVHVFSVTFKTPGNQTVTATDTASASIVGTSNSTSVASLAVTSVTNDASSFTVNFNEAFVASDVNLYDLPVPSGPLGPTNVTLTGGGSGSTNGPVSFHGSLILNSTNTGFTFVKTSSFNGQSFAPVTGAFAAGTYTVTLRSAVNGFHDSLGNLLSDINGVVGNNFVTTFVVAGAPAVVGIPSFARGPGNSVILPNNATSSANGSNQGIPINLSTITAAEAITSGSFTLVYNPALLTITGAAGMTLSGGQVVTLNAVVNTPGTAVITFTSSAALPSSSAAVGVRLGVLLANVPNGAAASYSSKAELSFTSESLNGGAVTITGDAAVEVVAYFGDANGDGTLSGGDAALISQVANTSPLNGTLPGFTAFRLADPVILGDLNTNGSVDAPDVTLINSFLSGTTRTQIPTVNPNNLTITHLGPDPLLSVPTNLVASVGSTVVVPVDIDTARPVGSTGMMEAILALEYNPKVFSVTPADVQLGSLTSGWQLETVVNAQTGQIGIDLFSLTPIQTTSGGSLVNISLHVRDSAPAGSTGLSIVNQVNPSGQRAFQTTVSDSQGALVLHTLSSGQWRVDGGRWTPEEAAVINSASRTVAGQDYLSSSPSTVHRPPSTEDVTEQVFADLAQVLLPESALALLPEANWQQPIAADSDQALVQQLDAGDNNWASADMVASLGQPAKASGRSPSGNLVDGMESGQDGADLKGLEEFFAREAQLRQ